MSRSMISSQQKKVLIEFFRKHPALISGKFVNITVVEANALWEQLTDLLNNETNGSSKSTKKWRQTWSDLKKNLKIKYAETPNRLSDLELDIINLLKQTSEIDDDDTEEPQHLDLQEGEEEEEIDSSLVDEGTDDEDYEPSDSIISLSSESSTQDLDDDLKLQSAPHSIKEISEDAPMGSAHENTQLTTEKQIVLNKHRRKKGRLLLKLKQLKEFLATTPKVSSSSCEVTEKYHEKKLQLMEQEQNYQERKLAILEETLDVSKRNLAVNLQILQKLTENQPVLN